jgi:hypothetical protein
VRSRFFKTLASRIPLLARATGYRFNPGDYAPFERLYRGYRLSDLDERTGGIAVSAIRFPDFSCNWSRFSRPEEVRNRQNGQPTDGCFSFSTEHARYNEMATTCHDPMEGNYARTEIRQLRREEDAFTEPPKRRKLEKAKDGWSRSQRLEYRQHLVFSLSIELEARA